MRLFFAIAAVRNFYVLFTDAGNAYTNARGPTIPTYFRVDDAYSDWYHTRFDVHIPCGMVVHAKHALQGHPAEAPRLWEKHIHGILVDKLHFVPTTHEKCLYSRRHPDAPEDLQMILRQVDDFLVSAIDVPRNH